MTNIFCIAYENRSLLPPTPYYPSSAWHGPTYAESTICTKIPPTGTYTRVAGNANFACALAVNGSIVCWGQPWFTSWTSIFNLSGPSAAVLFGNVWRADNLSISRFDSPYEVLSAPAEYTYTELCTATIFACGLTIDGNVICWSGIYGNGSRMVKWAAQSIRPTYPATSVYSFGILIAERAYDNITFTQLRCSAFSVCALTTNGSILCSGVPLPTSPSQTRPHPYVSVTSQNYIVDDVGTNPPIGSIGSMQFDRGQYCATTREDRSIRCDSSSRLNGQIAASAVGLAPISSYRMGGGTEIFRCPGNTYSTRRGAESSACDGPCKAGYVGRNTSASFTNELCGGLCPPGHYCVLGNKGPSPCPAGFYGANSGLTSSECTSICPAGSYCPSGSTNPTPCPTGSYGASPGLTNPSCSGLCQAGYICPAGSTSATQNPCQVNTYNLLSGSSHCLSCSGLDVVDCGGGIVTVKSSSHASIRLTKNSERTLLVELMTQPCPVGFCSGVGDTVTSRVNLTAVALFADSDSNTSMLIPLTFQCSEYHDQSIDSSLCGRCVDGYALSTTGACEQCNSVSWLKIALYIGVPWIIVIIFYILAHGHSGTLGVYLYFLQTVVIMLNGQTSSWLYSWLSIVGFLPLSLFDNQCLAPVSAEVYFALPIFIPFMQLLQLTIIILIHVVSKRCCQSSHHNDVVLDEMTMCYTWPDGHRLWYNSLWRCTSIFAFRLWPELTVATVARTVVLIAMASFTSTAFVSISWLDCSGVGINSSHVIWSFPAITCYTQSYWRWSILYIAVFVIWTTILLVMAICMWRYRIFISTLQSTSISTWKHVATLSANRFVPLLTSSVALVPIGAVSTSTSFLSPWNKERTMPLWLWSWYWPIPIEADEAGFVDMRSPVTPASFSVNENAMLTETRMSYAFRSVYSAVWDSYTPESVGWMIIILLRRLVLLVLSVSLSLHSQWKYISFGCLHLLILTLHNTYRPYTLAIVNRVEQMSIIVHLLMAMILAADIPEMSDDVQQAVLMSLTVIPIFAFMFMTAFRHATQERRNEQVHRAVSMMSLSLSLSAQQQIDEPLLSSSAL